MSFSFISVLTLAAWLCVNTGLALDLSDDSLLSRLDISEGRPAFNALHPPFSSMLEAPLAIRFAYVQAIARYEVAAACHPQALSFFGTKDSIPATFCDPVPRAVILCLIIYRINLKQFPLEAQPFGTYLAQQGLNVSSQATDTSTPTGWANSIANRANNYLSSDGWNSRGSDKQPAPLRRPYEDTSGYTPRNNAETSPRSLPFPLRWQPLSEKSRATGGFKLQTFAVPHLGSALPLTTSRAGIRKRISRPPYRNPGRPRSLSARDGVRVRSLLRNFLKTSRNLTPKQRFLARWWENKRISLGSFLPFYATRLGLSGFQQDYIRLAQAIAQHDSLIVGWREKRYHDAVRPTTLIRRYYGGRKIKVFVSEDVGVAEIDGDDYEPITPVQAHPEFPSGSALICVTGLQSLQLALAGIVGSRRLPPFTLAAEPGKFGFPHTKTIDVSYKNLREAALDCGESRLWAGVHFPPAVDAGNDLASGIGAAAFKQVQTLVQGEVPRSCNRCIKKT